MIIDEYLKNEGITKYEFAKRCRMPYGTVNDICNGKTDIAKCTGETLMKLAEAMNITVDTLLRDRFGMYSSDLKKITEIITPIAKKYRLSEVYIFGSYARNEATEESDIDILIDREDSLVHGLFGMNTLYNELKEALGKDIDLITLQSLNQTSTQENNANFVKNVMREKVKIYGKSR